MIPVEVILWDKLVGVIVWDEKSQTTSFEYVKSFVNQGLEVSPLMAPIKGGIVNSPINNNESNNDSNSSKGLPLFISDSLPDKFGTELLLKYLEQKGKSYRDLTPIEKLTYIGNRGMGALEYKPSKPQEISSKILNLSELNKISIALLNNQPIASVSNLASLIHIGTSAGGAQPKILININNKTGAVYRGDNLPTKSQESWILKFNADTGLASDKERGKIEYAYYLIAKKSGINIMHSELKEFDGQYYFMTRRFDRKDGEKIHTQTLHAFAGMNFRLPNTYSYEQIFMLFNKMGFDYVAKEQLFKIMVFNVIGKNVDDHTKNFSFLMDKQGNWSFAPAYDLTFTYNENYNRPTPHFLSINGKNSNHNLKDIVGVATQFGIKKPLKIINAINQAFLDWNTIASNLHIAEPVITTIKSKLKTMPFFVSKVK